MSFFGAADEGTMKAMLAAATAPPPPRSPLCVRNAGEQPLAKPAPPRATDEPLATARFVGTNDLPGGTARAAALAEPLRAPRAPPPKPAAPATRPLDIVALAGKYGIDAKEHPQLYKFIDDDYPPERSAQWYAQKLRGYGTTSPFESLGISRREDKNEDFVSFRFEYLSVYLDPRNRHNKYVKDPEGTFELLKCVRDAALKLVQDDDVIMGADDDDDDDEDYEDEAGAAAKRKVLAKRKAPKKKRAAKKKSAAKPPKARVRVRRKTSGFRGLEGDQAKYEAVLEKKLRADADAYPGTGKGASSDYWNAVMTQTAAKVIKDFEEHKAKQLAARVAGADWEKSQIAFYKFFNKLRVSTGRRTKAAKAAKAAKVLKKSVVKKL